MADSTELIFVSCPSCKSLMSASAKVCRMCGATLEAGNVGDSNDQKKISRVRQRTMSSQSDEVNMAVSKIREEMGVPPAPPPAPAPQLRAPANPQPSSTDQDPLSAYIREIELAEERAAREAQKAGIGPSPTVGFGMSPAFIPSELEQVAPQPVPSIETRQTPAPEVNPVIAQPRASASVSPELPPEAAETRDESENRPRVIVESGGRRNHKGPGLSFARPKEDRKEASQDTPPAEGPRHSEPPSFEKSKSVIPERAPSQQESPRAERVAVRPPTPPPVVKESAKEVIEAKEIEKVAKEREKERDIPTDSRQGAPQSNGQDRVRSYEVHKRNINSGGRLCGWLVSYRESDGRSIELREGKFFITRNRVKDSDLVIDDKTISTPHALCAVGAETKVRIQDLMSDQGVAIRRKGDNEFIKISETVELDHGDAVRLGEMEFQLCLVAHVGVK